MISEGSCDTEDWGNDVENSAFHPRNKLHVQIYIQLINTQIPTIKNFEFFLRQCNDD